MTWISFLCFIVPSILLWPHSLSQAATSNLKQGQQLHDWDQLISAEGVFKLGFFSPGSKSVDIGVIAPRYIAIWFNEIPFYPLWVANPHNPIPDSSGVLKLDTDGILKIAYQGGSPVAVSSTSNHGKKANSDTNFTATLLDSGNLIVREIGADGKIGPVLWQSFDYPSNMLLPEMKLGINLKTGHEWYLTSWLSEQLPTPGAFKLGLNPNGSRELMVWRRGDVYWRSGEWNNGKFELAPKLTERVDAYQFRFVTNENESYFSYSKKSKAILSKWLLGSVGEIEQFTVDRPGRNGWIWETTSPCNSDYRKNASGVCLNEKPTKCRNGSEFFEPRRGFMNWSSIGDYWDANEGLALSDCHSKCWTNCTCIAYNSYYENGTGCQFWSWGSEFTPSENYPDQDIYVLTRDLNSNATSVRDCLLLRWFAKTEGEKMVKEEEMVTPGDILGKAAEVKAGKGAYLAKHNGLVYASLTGLLRTLSPPPDSPDQRPTVEVTGHKAHGAVPEPGSIVIARITKVMARMASADIMCVGPKSVREKFTGIIRQQDVRATEIDKVDMHLSFRPGDIVRALVLSLGDSRAYFLSTAKNELGVVSAESTAGETMVPISWTEMRCPVTGQIEKRKVAKVGS